MPVDHCLSQTPHHGAHRGISRSYPMLTPWPWCPQRDFQELSHADTPSWYPQRDFQELSFPLHNFSGVELHCRENEPRDTQHFFLPTFCSYWHKHSLYKEANRLGQPESSRHAIILQGTEDLFHHHVCGAAAVSALPRALGARR